MEAFDAYDFGSDPRWQKYRAGIEIPPGRNEEEMLRKYKAKWYQREVDSAFEFAPAVPPPAQPAPQPSAGATSSAQSQELPQGAEPSRPAGAAPQTASGNGQPDSSAAAAQGWQDKLSKLTSRLPRPGTERTQLILFIMHVMLIVLALLTLQPVNRSWSRFAWIYFLQISIICSGYKVYLTSGLPGLRPFLPSIQSWLLRVGHTTDFQYMFYAIIFLVQQPLTLALVPITVLAVYHAFAYCAKNFSQNKLWRRYGVKAHSFLARHQRDALFYNAGAEIGVGFFLVAMLLTPRRAMMNTFAYWHWLRMRYASPDSAAYQSMVWSALDQKVGVYARQSILRVPLGFAQRWFLSASRQ